MSVSVSVLTFNIAERFLPLDDDPDRKQLETALVQSSPFLYRILYLGVEEHVINLQRNKQDFSISCVSKIPIRGDR